MDQELLEMLPELAFIEEEITSYKKRIKEMEERKAEISSKIIEHFENVDIKPIETEQLKISYVKPSVRFSIDKEGLEQKYPEIANEFLKETNVKSSIRIKLKENE